MKVSSTDYFGVGFHAWSMDNTPCIARNQSETVQYGVEPGRIAMHPGFDGPNEQALLVFTAPAPGTYNVTLKFLYTGGGDGVDVSAIRNPAGGDGGGNETVFFTEELNPSLPDYDWTDTVELKAGETLVFAVGNGNANSNGGDGTVVELVISRKGSMWCPRANLLTGGKTLGNGGANFIGAMDSQKEINFRKSDTLKQMQSPRKTLRNVPAGSHGFTLVELLVVIAIIALLAALLYPSIQGAMDSAKTAKCAANMRQLVQACHAFAADNDGSLPPLYTWAVLFPEIERTKDKIATGAGVFAWPDFIRPYVGNDAPSHALH